jgi:ppGpp synthetase/RelA/SpoT-type nucleotidyltranferase
VARKYIADYPASSTLRERAASELEGLLTEVVDRLPIDFPIVLARSKKHSSVIRKVIKKGYGRPSRQVTDAVAARVITYYPEDVDVVVAALRADLEVDDRRSQNRREPVENSRFGYRSVHLIASAAGAYLTRYRSLERLTFEIQVRSLLEHSWAQIEHDVVYKSDIRYPPSIERRFAALAAVLELLDDSFQGLKAEEWQLKQAYIAAYEAGNDLDEALDAGRLAAFMHARFPINPGWHGRRTTSSIEPDMASRLSQLLELSGIDTARALDELFGQAAAQTAFSAYATATGRAVDELAHPALVLVAVGTAHPELVVDCFPLEGRNPEFETALGIGA